FGSFVPLGAALPKPDAVRLRVGDVPICAAVGARRGAPALLSCAYVGEGLSGSPAIGTAAGDHDWKVLSPIWCWPVIISFARRPFVTTPFVNSIRPLSKYWTSRLPPAASRYGSCSPARAFASGP